MKAVLDRKQAGWRATIYRRGTIQPTTIRALSSCRAAKRAVVNLAGGKTIEFQTIYLPGRPLN